ncbi:MAG TPA: hypothetical protein VJ547_01670 [Candidatus Thermoplasmatota archaeon]|nr:hypothetical protein [Candidatus Thermoplasmatota archaeon]
MTDAERPAEERRVRKKQAGVVKRALDERDAALVERVRAMKIANEYRDGNAQMYEEMLEARAEAEALRARADALESIAITLRMALREEGVETPSIGKLLTARFSPPAPAPALVKGDCPACKKLWADHLPAGKHHMDERCEFWKPAPETAKCNASHFGGFDQLGHRDNFCRECGVRLERGAPVKAVNEHERQTHGRLPGEGAQEIQRVASEEERGGQGRSRTIGLGSGHEATGRMVGQVEPPAENAPCDVESPPPGGGSA